MLILFRQKVKQKIRPTILKKGGSMIDAKAEQKRTRIQAGKRHQIASYSSP